MTVEADVSPEHAVESRLADRSTSVRRTKLAEELPEEEPPARAELPGGGGGEDGEVDARPEHGFDEGDGGDADAVGDDGE